MTFSLTARCPRTGMFGVVITSSSICVAARCAWARAGVGAIATQNITDPRLADLGLSLLAQGFGAKAACELLVKARDFPEYRQLAVVDDDGHIAHHSGEKMLGRHAVVAGEACVAAGNLLASEKVPEAMVKAYAQADGEHFAERLVRALEAGLSAGGEEGSLRSAGLHVVNRHRFAIADLRVDWDELPIGRLREIWEEYRTQMDDYVLRALDPREAPSYGVPGDP